MYNEKSYVLLEFLPSEYEVLCWKISIKYHALHVISSNTWAALHQQIGHFTAFTLHLVVEINSL